MATSLGFRQATEIIEGSQTDAYCPATNLRRNDGNSFENNYLWDGDGVSPPDYGSWAESFNADFVCAVQFSFTQIGNHTDQTMDVYVWESGALGNPPPGPDPGNVIVMIPGPGECATSSVPDDDMDGADAHRPSTWGAIKALC